jgi:hypothetical protein
VMRRRSFLKAAGLTALAASLPFGISPVAAAARPVAAGGLLYRPDGGRILVSRDAGATWTVHTNLGSDYAVRRLEGDGASGVRAGVGFGKRTFDLVLGADQRSWFTV